MNSKIILILKIIFPLILGYAVFSFCDNLTEQKFPVQLNQENDLDTPGIVYATEILIDYLKWIFFVVIQYFIIVPKTRKSILKATILTVSLGLLFGQIFFIGCYFGDKISLEKSLIAFFKVLVQFESFWLPNLLLIAVINKITVRKNEVNLT